MTTETIMFVVTLFGFAMLHMTATECIAGIPISIQLFKHFVFRICLCISTRYYNLIISIGDCMSEPTSEIKSGENFYFVNNLDYSKQFGNYFFNNFYQMIQEMTLSNQNNINVDQPTNVASNALHE